MQQRPRDLPPRSALESDRYEPDWDQTVVEDIHSVDGQVLILTGVDTGSIVDQAKGVSFRCLALTGRVEGSEERHTVLFQMDVDAVAVLVARLMLTFGVEEEVVRRSKQYVDELLPSQDASSS